MPVTIDLAVAKTHKFASRESGDTVELVERPAGGVSVVVVDGQGSGAGAKRLSLLVAGRVVTLLNEGVRDGAAARAAHDFLFAHRAGQVSAALDIVSIDLASKSLVFTRSSEVPMVLRRGAQLELIEDSGGRIGLRRHMRPRVLEFPIEPDLGAVIVTDGVASAGRRFGEPSRLVELVEAAHVVGSPDARLADRILQAAIQADRGRPQDDMAVVVLQLEPGAGEPPIRRLALSIPVERV